MDRWTDTVLTLGFFLDILHVRKVAKKILSFSKYSTSSHSCVKKKEKKKEKKSKKKKKKKKQTNKKDMAGK